MEKSPNYGFLPQIVMATSGGKNIIGNMVPFSQILDDYHGPNNFAILRNDPRMSSREEVEFLSYMFSTLGEASEHNVDITALDNEVYQHYKQAGFSPQGFENFDSIPSCITFPRYTTLDALAENDAYQLRHARTVLIWDTFATKAVGTLACPPPLLGARIVDVCVGTVGAAGVVNDPRRVFPGRGRCLTPGKFHQPEVVPYRYDVLILARKELKEKICELASYGVIDDKTIIFATKDGINGPWDRYTSSGDLLKASWHRGPSGREEFGVVPMSIPDIGDKDVRERVEKVEEPLPSNDVISDGPTIATIQHEVLTAIGEDAKERRGEHEVNVLAMSGGPSLATVEGWDPMKDSDRACGLRPHEFFCAPARSGAVNWFVTQNYLREVTLDLERLSSALSNEVCWAEIPLGRRAFIKVVDGEAYMAVVERVMRYYKCRTKLPISDSVFRGVISGDNKYVWVYDLVSHPLLTVDAWFINRNTILEKLFLVPQVCAAMKLCEWKSRPEYVVTTNSATALYGIDWYAPPYCFDTDRNWMFYMLPCCSVGLRENSLIETRSGMGAVVDLFQERQGQYWMRLYEDPPLHSPMNLDKAEFMVGMRLDWWHFNEVKWSFYLPMRRLAIVSFLHHKAYDFPERRDEYNSGNSWRGVRLQVGKNMPTHFAYEMAFRRLMSKTMKKARTGATGLGNSPLDEIHPDDAVDWHYRIGGVKPYSDLMVTSDGYYVV